MQALLQHNAKVYLASRSRQRGEAAIQDLVTETGKQAIFLELDLGSLASVRRAAEEFLRCVSRSCHIFADETTQRCTDFDFVLSLLCTDMTVKKRNCISCSTMRMCSILFCSCPLRLFDLFDINIPAE